MLFEQGEEYATRYENDYGYEAVLVDARRRMVLETLDRLRPRTLVEVGCGLELLFDAAANVDSVERWVVIEPMERFYAIAHARSEASPKLRAVRGYVEEKVDEITAAIGGLADVVVASGVFQEVADTGRHLRTLHALVEPGGYVYVDVSNAYSFHRRLACAMDLIADPHELSDRNRLFGQTRVHDKTSLRTAVEAAGFEVVEEGGYMVKPFTNDQMEAIAKLLPPDLNRGLWLLGRALPELAAEIYVTAQKPLHSRA